MFLPARMEKIDIVVLVRYLDDVVKFIGKFGNAQIIEVKRGKIEEKESETFKKEMIKVKHIIDRITKYIDISDIKIKEDIYINSRELISVAERLKEAIYPEIENLNALNEKKQNIESAIERMQEFKGLKWDISKFNENPFLYIVYGMAELNQEELNSILPKRAIALEVMPKHFLFITTKKGRWALESELRKIGFKRLTLDNDTGSTSPEGMLKKLEKELEDINNQINLTKNNLDKLKIMYGKDIAKLRDAILLKEKIESAKSMFGFTSMTAYISCWIRKKDESRFIKRLEEITNGSTIIESYNPEDIEEVRQGKLSVPVILDNPSFLKPFEKIVCNYGMPAYNEIDPTPLFAFAFILLFGVMFGDVGHGFILTLLGLILPRIKKLKKLRDSISILISMGIASMITGVLYGSVFGFEDIIRPLWDKPLHAISKLFVITISFGAIFLSIGIILNFINSIRKKDLYSGVFSQSGLFGALFYWGALGIIVKGVVSGESITLSAFAVLIVPLILIFLREPIYNLITKKKKLIHGSIGMYLMESTIEVIDVISHFLANTVSFVRVAAFALSHMGLCMAIFELAKIVKSMPMGNILGWTIIVLGNLLVIVLEGMVATIQVIRLEYYEFFGKFFSGSGKPFNPFKI